MNKLPDCIESKLTGLSLPARAWALAKAAYETAREANFAEQEAAIKAATLDDPEPPEPEYDPADPADRPRQGEWRAWCQERQAWRERNSERIEAALAPIVACYPTNLKELMNRAEANLVDAAKEQARQKMGEGFFSIQPAFEAYRGKQLFGDMHERFLTICFNLA
jgi:hypothetical protein